MELQARKQREARLEAALSEKEIIEEEYRKKAEEAKKKEAALENDLANMWVLVAQLKKEAKGPDLDSNSNVRQVERPENVSHLKVENGDRNNLVKERQVLDVLQTANDVPKEEPLVARLKARMQEMKEKEKEKEVNYVGNGDANSHVCKVCFESPTTAMLLPCRHFSLCKSCSLACTECPICRTKIADRIFAFAS